MVDAHKRFENEVQSHEPEVNQVRNLFESIPQKTPKDQEKLDKVGSTKSSIITPSKRKRL